MTALVGIDAEILFVSSTDAAGHTAELPTWNPTTQLWDLTATNYDWTQITERNEISLNISVDVAEHKVFVTNINNAWVEKARLYMDWSGSISGYYDDADNNIFTTMKAGLNIYLLVVDSKAHIVSEGAPTKYWFGKALLTSVDHGIPNEDFSTLDVDFEGNGILYRNATPSGNL